MVYYLVVDPARHHRHEPLPEHLVEQGLLLDAARDGDSHRQLHDIVLPVPGWQAVQVVDERMVGGHIARVDHKVEIRLAHRLHAEEDVAQRVAQAFAHRLPVIPDELCQLTVDAEGVIRRYPRLHPSLHHIVAQVDVPVEERLDLLWRGIHLAPVLLVFFFLRAVPLGSGFLLFLLCHIIYVNMLLCLYYDVSYVLFI